MTFTNYDIASSEFAFQNDSYARESSYRDIEERDMQDIEIATEDEVRNDAYEASLPVRCDGSGVVEETYIGVDQTFVVACVGCPACEVKRPELLGDDRPEPDWMHEPEMVEFGVRRKPAGTEPGMPGRKVA